MKFNVMTFALGWLAASAIRHGWRSGDWLGVVGDGVVVVAALVAMLGLAMERAH